MLPVVHPFLWALPLVGVPVLIHLINMFRHQPVHWAAMEFLLASQKKYRTWVVLEQLLLLLLRMAAIALVVWRGRAAACRSAGRVPGRAAHAPHRSSGREHSMSDRRGG